MLSIRIEVRDIQVGDVIKHPHGFSGEVTQVHATDVKDIPEGGAVSGWLKTKAEPNKVQGWSYRFGTWLTVGREEEPCCYGSSGSMASACDEMATEVRDGFPYCHGHASWHDWCVEHAGDPE